MERREILHTRLGDLLELSACDAIAHGAAPKREKLSLQEALELR